MKTIEVTLEQLRPGHEYPGESVNSRTAYRDKEIEELAALLAEEGQLKPLLGCRHPADKTVIYVFDGNRRRLAFESLINSGRVARDLPIEVKDFGTITPQEALRKSWAANEQVPLHPADRYAAFAQIAGTGAEPKDIAARYGITTKAVAQSLAFGANLATEVLDAWRAGEISTDVAKIFTLGDKDDQVDQLEKRRKEWKGRSWHKDTKWSEAYDAESKLRKAFTGNEADAARLLKFVGEAAYTAEGGRIAKDLFDEGGKDRIVVQDLAKLKKLAKAKLQKKVDALTAEGWSWVDVSLSPHFHDWNFGKSKDKTKAGCVVRVAGSKIEVKSGLTKKTAEDRNSGYSGYQTREDPAEDYKAKEAISDAVSAAAGAAMASNRKLCLAVLLASTTSGYGSAVDVAFGETDLGITHAKTFDAALDEFLKVEEAKLGPIVAQAVSAAVQIKDPKKTKLIGLLDQDAYARGLQRFFKPKDYFSGCSAKHLLKCIGEALGPDQKRQNEGKTKDVLVKFCIASVGPTGWLPERLRTKSYTAPNPKRAGAEAVKTEAAAKPKRKAA